MHDHKTTKRNVKAAAAKRDRAWLLAVAALVTFAAVLTVASGLLIMGRGAAGGTASYECISLCDRPEGTVGQQVLATAEPDSGYRFDRWHCVTPLRIGVCPGEDAAEMQYLFIYDGSLRLVMPKFLEDIPPPEGAAAAAPLRAAPLGVPIQEAGPAAQCMANHLHILRNYPSCGM